MAPTKAAFLAALWLSSVTAHWGCDSYQHGVDLFKRDPAQAAHEAQLRKRHPSVNARVLLSGHEALEKRASPTTYAASLTRVHTAAVNALSSGTGTPGGLVDLPTTPAAGARPSAIPGANALPSVTINPADWPTLDRPPPVDTDEVRLWMSQIDFANIPNIPVTGLNGCENTTYNAQSIADAAKNGWWTCAGIARNTDITYCPDRNTWGVSLDDGPSPFSPQVLNYLDAANLKSTFFVVGSRVISRPDMLQYEYMDGHQIAVHTWSHFPLTTLTNEQIVAELGWSKKAIYEVTGATPLYMRPPYGDIDDRVRYISMQMGLTPIIWTRYNGGTFDTRDWQIAGGNVNVSTVIANFDSILSQAPNMPNGFIVLAHDLYQQSANLAVDYIFPRALANPDLSLQTIIECLGKDLAQAYVETATNATSPLVPTTPVLGASDSGLVQGLSVTPVAIGGDYTGPGSTLGVTGQPTNGGGGNPAQTTGSNNQAASSSGAATLTLSFALLLATALAMLVAA